MRKSAPLPGRKILQASLAIFCCAASVCLYGQARGGSVVATGNVKVDGKEVVRSGNIFPGEKLETGAQSAASITNNGAVSSVQGKAAVTYYERYLEMDCGRVNVTTVSGFAVHVSDVIAAPAEQQARFEVVQGSGRIRIQALDGRLSVSRGQDQSSLNPGEAKEFASKAACLIPPAIPWTQAFLFSASTIPIWLNPTTSPPTPPQHGITEMRP